jgi:hypothetical protein
MRLASENAKSAIIQPAGNHQLGVVALSINTDIPFFSSQATGTTAGRFLPFRIAEPCGQKSDVYHSRILHHPYHQRAKYCRETTIVL